MTRVSVVLPNLNGEQLLPRSLGPLAVPGRHEREVILVDNGSTDRSIEVAHDVLPEVRIVARPTNEGFATACNRGVNASSSEAEFILFLNTDVALSSNCLDDLVDWAADDLAAGVWQPKLLRADRKTWDSAGSFFTPTGFLWHDAFEDADEDAENRPRDIFAAKGACFLVRRQSFSRVGGFDDSFFAYFEETDLCWRIQLAGWAVRYVPICCAYHDVGATTTRFFTAEAIDFLSFRNRVTSIVKNAGGRTLLCVLPIHLGACVGSALALCCRGRWKSGLAVLRGTATALASPRRIARSRRMTQTLRTRPDSAFLPSVTRRMTSARARQLLLAYLPRW